MTVIYNEIEPYAADWLENLIAAGHIAYGRVERRSIRDLQPSELAGTTQAHFFAGIGVWSHALRLAGVPDHWPIWTGSCPCFVAGTLILTSDGHKPIEEVRVGDWVYTHQNRYRQVLRRMVSTQSTVVVKGQGSPPITTTPEHPFLACKTPPRRTRNLSAPEWVEAKDLRGWRWALPTKFCAATIPPLNERDWQGQVQVPNDLGSPAFARFLGYWLGDGWTTNQSKRPGTVILCGDRRDGPLLEELAQDAGLKGNHTVEKTSSRLRIGSKLLAVWLDWHFGFGASSKKIPALVHHQNDEWRAAFLEGLLLADGHDGIQNRGGGKIENLTTTSKAVAIGVRILFNQAGYSASVGFKKPSRVECLIEGRKVNEQGFYRVTKYEHARSFRFGPTHAWGIVKPVEPTGKNQTVFNLEVSEDNSYVADGIVVHNCQPFSVAGKKGGTADERHLWPAWHKLIDARRPPLIFGEQVSSKDGLAWLDLVLADLEASGYTAGAFDLAACGVGAPHKRNRLYFYAYAPGVRRERRRSGQAGDGSDTARLESERLRHARGGAHTNEIGWRRRQDVARHVGDGADRRRAEGERFAEPRSGPHAYLLPDADAAGRQRLGALELQRRGDEAGHDPGGLGASLDGGDAGRVGAQRHPGAADGAQAQVSGAWPQPGHGGDAFVAAGPAGDGDDAERSRLEGHCGHVRDWRGPGWLDPHTARSVAAAGATGGFWGDCDWYFGRDGKYRAIESGLFPLAHGAFARVGRLRAYGNAIVAPLAAEFVRAVMEELGLLE